MELPVNPVGIGIIGSQFVAGLHAEAFKRVPEAQVIAVASPTQAHVQAFAGKHHIPKWFTDYRELLKLKEVQIVSLCLPNDLHCQATVDAAKAGKHVICEKPLCLNLQEADQMIAACKQAGVKLMYAEELCFTPKYVRAKQLVDEGPLGKVYLIKQSKSILARIANGSGTWTAAAAGCCSTWAVTASSSLAGSWAGQKRRVCTPSAALTFTRTRPAATITPS
jgi:predicted dehydrogenase